MLGGFRLNGGHRSFCALLAQVQVFSIVYKKEHRVSPCVLDWVSYPILERMASVLFFILGHRRLYRATKGIDMVDLLRNNKSPPRCATRSAGTQCVRVVHCLI